MALAIGIVGTAARFAVEQAAMQARIGNLASIFVLKFEKTALRAPIANQLPFLRGHLVQTFRFPEPIFHRSDVALAKKTGQPARAPLCGGDDNTPTAAPT